MFRQWAAARLIVGATSDYVQYSFSKQKPKPVTVEEGGMHRALLRAGVSESK